MLRDSVEIANLFNQYFIDVGPSLANRIDSNRHFRDYLRIPSVNQLTLRSIDENKISQVIEHLKNKSSSGVDGIFNNLMARCELVKPLTKIKELRISELRILFDIIHVQLSEHDRIGLILL